MNRIDYGVQRRRARGKMLWPLAIVLVIACLYFGWHGLNRLMEGETVRNAPTARTTIRVRAEPAGCSKGTAIYNKLN